MTCKVTTYSLIQALGMLINKLEFTKRLLGNVFLESKNMQEIIFGDMKMIFPILLL